jgi:hypothetical protein
LRFNDAGCGVNNGFSATSDVDPYLVREEECADVSCNPADCNFGYQSSDGFSNCYGADIAILFVEGRERGSCQIDGERFGGLACK